MVAFVAAAASITLYVCSAGLSAFKAVHSGERFSVVSRFLFLAAFLLHSASIGMESVSTSGTVLYGPNVLMLASWVLSAMSLFVSVLSRRPYGYLAIAATTVAVFMLIAQIGSTVLGYERHGIGVQGQWNVLVVHILLFLGAMACFAVGAAASVMQLYQRHLMKGRSVRLFNSTMPAIDVLNAVAKRANLAGLPLFTLGMLLGFGRYATLYGAASAHDGSVFFSLSYLAPRIGLSVVVWAVFVLFLALSYLAPHRASSNTRSWLSVGGFAGCLVLMIVTAA